MDASDAERSRIATDLHDGVVQDLAGLAFSLSAAEDRAHARGNLDTAALLERAAASARRCVRQIRSSLVDIHPPNLGTVGLEAGLRDLLAPLQARGIEATLVVETSLDLAVAAERLVFVAAREAIRNVAAHADACSTRVEVTVTGGCVTLVVVDDGQGFEPHTAPGPQDGHLGLSLLSDLAVRAGGALDVDSRPGSGTRVALEVPAR
jgi:signal transduction histidine kinase